MVHLRNKFKIEVLRGLVTPLVVIFIFIAFPFTSFCQWQPSKATLSKADRVLEQFFGSEFSKTTIDQNSNIYQINFSDSLVAYACIQQAPSKHDMFEFLAIYSSDMELLKLRVLTYRENYGGEIANKRWLNQFVTRTPQQVQAISGATISVESLKKSVSKLNFQMNSWYKSKS